MTSDLRFYYYLQLSIGILSHANIRQAQLKPKHTLLECYAEFDDEYIERHKLLHIGRGWEKDKHIVERLRRYLNA